MSYCTRFDGSFTDAKGRQQMVAVGSRYRLRVSMVGPVALADAAKQVSPRREEVSVWVRLLQGLMGGRRRGVGWVGCVWLAAQVTQHQPSMTSANVSWLAAVASC